MITIRQVFYSKREDQRILEACLRDWFRIPKDLNLTSPNMKYPFDFKKWVAGSYLKEGISTYVAKSDNWIVGHMSLAQYPERLHIFHLIVDSKQRGKGIGKKLIEYGIGYAKKKNYKKVTLRVAQKNENAIKLYERFGFSVTGIKDTSYEMELDLNS